MKVAIIEDEVVAAEQLQQMIEQFAMSKNIDIEIRYISNAINFLTNYKPVYDLIFMDIQMPYMDGMTAAAKLRELDSETLLIFVTNMGHLAVKGYEVAAFDFVVKPLHYESLVMKMERVLNQLARGQEEKIVITSNGLNVLIPIYTIFYVEVFDHKLVYHTRNGDYAAYGTMKKVTEQLGEQNFFQCNKCYLINLRYVSKVEKYIVTVNNTELQISHPKKKAFMEALNNYIGG